MVEVLRTDRGRSQNAFVRPLLDSRELRSRPFSGVPRGPVYEGPRVETGQPIFPRLVKTFTVAFDYRMESTAAGSLSGTAGLKAELSNTNGWVRSIELQPETSFNGDRFSVEASSISPDWSP